MPKEVRFEIQLIDKIVSNNIKKHRITHGLSQRVVAKVIGVSTQQLQKYVKRD